MATRISITPVIYKQYCRKDGSYPVKIRVSFDRQSKYITTNIIAQRGQLNKALEPKDNNLREKVSSVIDRMCAAVNSIDVFWLDGKTVDDVVRKIQQIIREEDYVFSLDFYEYGEKIALEKPRNSKINYMCAIHSFQEYTNTKKLEISAITSTMMRGYESFLKKKHGENARAVSLYTSAIAYIHKRAQAEFNNEETGEIYISNPFVYYKCPKQKPSRHRAASKEAIQTLINIRETLSGRQRIGADMFLLSFALMGMNSPDMYDCKPAKDGILIYHRTKTRDRRADNAEIRIRIENYIDKLYGEYIDSTGKRAFRFYLRYSDYKNLSRAANLGLHELSKALKLEDELTIYSARHAWATIAYSIGINKTIINDCLVHVDRDMRTTDIYVEKDWSVLWKANKKVLSKFKWG